jgi:transcriptional regulator with XRE-family HTH domain
MDIREVVGRRLRELRKLKGLSQEQMAELAGVNSKYYSEVERGKRNMTIKVIERIASNLGMSLGEVFRFPTNQKLSPLGEEVVALVISALKSKDERSLDKLKIFLTDILD